MKCLILSAALAALPVAVNAEEAPATRPGSALPQLQSAPAEAPFGAVAVSENTLQAVAGREDTNQLSQAELAAGVSNNSVGDNAVTGNAQIDAMPFRTCRACPSLT